MHTYLITFNGFGANRVTYYDQTVTIKARHDWSLNAEEGANVIFLAHKKVKEHFNKYKILSVEVVK